MVIHHLFLQCMRKDKHLFEKAGLVEVDGMSSIVANLEGKAIDFIHKRIKGKWPNSPSCCSPPSKKWPRVPCCGWDMVGWDGGKLNFVCDGRRYAWRTTMFGTVMSGNAGMIDMIYMLFELLKRSHNSKSSVRVGLSLTERWHDRAWVNDYGLSRKDGPVFELENGQKIWLTNGKICWER